ncbi:DUF2141 domain-containing protein [Kozakia baliensis]|uniref:DUF2141 domain-containing protein n=1 Tax=Kozakia baliensis TaxID=153496 RepID=UPI00087BF1CF|nr:DUF2141 domain-containing protein [Kozakia baliensis]AOX19540.1 hypothetical protein A0U90_03695 [Kozakia baliensis]
MKHAKALFLIAIGAAYAPQVKAATVTVAIDNIPDAQGTIRIALCDRGEFLKPACHYHVRLPSVPQHAEATLNDVSPGTYAVQVFQDRDNNGKLKRNFFGIPQEPLGFSRNPKMRFGPPSFDDADLAIGPAGATIAVQLITK